MFECRFYPSLSPNDYHTAATLQSLKRDLLLPCSKMDAPPHTPCIHTFKGVWASNGHKVQHRRRVFSFTKNLERNEKPSVCESGSTLVVESDVVDTLGSL